MINKIIKKLLRHRHFWREIGFDELSELYVSMMFRSLSMSLIGIFVPIYLLQLGYSLREVIAFIILFFITKVIMDVAAGYTVARIGPKHTMLISYAAQIAASIFYILLPEYAWPLFIPALLSGTANALFFVAYHVDFSKIKHTEHGGKELGYANIMEKAGGVLGPLTGGLVATLFGAQYTFVVATILLFVGAIPLMKTAEPIRTHQYFTFRKLPWGRIKRDMVSYAALSVENNLSVNLWPIFLTLFVISGGLYAKVGALASLSVVASIFAAQAIGRLIDARKGGLLLRYSAISMSGLHIFKPFVSSLSVALGVGVLNELLTAGLRLPYIKGWYDRADQLPGHRIAYIVATEVAGEAAKLSGWVVLYGVSLFAPDRIVMTVGFVMAALSSILILTHKFPALVYTRR